MDPLTPPSTELRKISADRTWFYKTIFPILWFGILAAVTMMIVVSIATSDHPPPVAVLIGPIFMMGVGYLLMSKLIFDLADEVWEGSDFLDIRIGNNKERIFFSNIINLNYMMMNPPRATLTLREPCSFGKEIVFCPLMSFSDFRTSLNFRNGLMDELIHKVDAVRKRS